MSTANKVRLDKWLWAARFYKTRAKAKEAIDGGKVHIDGTKGKASKELQVGIEIRLRQGWDEKTVIVRALSDQRASMRQLPRHFTKKPLKVSSTDSSRPPKENPQVNKQFPGNDQANETVG